MGRLIPSFILAIILIFSNSEIAGSVEEIAYTEPTIKFITPLNFKAFSYESKPAESIEPLYETFNVSSYTSGYESTGKRPRHPEYNVTASGEKVKENYTIACPKSMEFGTKIYIPYFDNTFTCTDRGGLITEGHLDVYMKKLKDAQDFGRQQLEVKIIKLDENKM